VAVPYGNNSNLLIFEKSFFAGGMNGIRAWQARTLGPGNYNREVLHEELRLNLRNLDQLGEVKLEANFEYRFRIMNSFLGAKLNGATFVDMGNIWRLREDQLNPDGEFKFAKLYEQTAVGTGFGLRFDMDYFILRLDAGLKVKDPQFGGNDQWVLKHFFHAKSFKEEYYQNHRPDRYNFIQYNFGVGLPF
jgi:outer membrane protein assembly factor BamA